jgi:hypothetical protein
VNFVLQNECEIFMDLSVFTPPPPPTPQNYEKAVFLEDLLSFLRTVCVCVRRDPSQASRGPNAKFQFCQNQLYQWDGLCCSLVFRNQQWLMTVIYIYMEALPRF